MNLGVVWFQGQTCFGDVLAEFDIHNVGFVIG